MTSAWHTPFDAYGHDLARWSGRLNPTHDGLREIRVTFGPRSQVHKPIIVSFATAEYLPAARRLAADCQRLELDHDIAYLEIPTPPATVRLTATRLKRGYIQSMLILHQRPVWWLDVDSGLNAAPPPIPPEFWLAVHHQPARRQFPIRSSVFYLAPHPQTWRLLDAWHALHKPTHEDHTPLCKAWSKIQTDPGVLLLDVSPWFLNNASPTPPRPPGRE